MTKGAKVLYPERISEITGPDFMIQKPWEYSEALAIYAQWLGRFTLGPQQGSQQVTEETLESLYWLYLGNCWAGADRCDFKTF